MEYKNIKPKRALTVLLILFLVFAAAISCFVSIYPAGIYAEWARFGVYSTMEGMDNFIPKGSLIITDRTSVVSENYVAAAFIKNGDSAYPDDTYSVLLGILKIDDGIYNISNDNKSLEVNKQQVETVVFYIDHIGTAFYVMHNYRYFIWAGWAAVFAVVIVMIATSSNRRNKKKQKQLVKIFEFYGEKYDSEEQDTDY